VDEITTSKVYLGSEATGGVWFTALMRYVLKIRCMPVLIRKPPRPYPLYLYRPLTAKVPNPGTGAMTELWRTWTWHLHNNTAWKMSCLLVATCAEKRSMDHLLLQRINRMKWPLEQNEGQLQTKDCRIYLPSFLPSPTEHILKDRDILKEIKTRKQNFGQRL
jgi:hypothetical protein